MHVCRIYGSALNQLLAIAVLFIPPNLIIAVEKTTLVSFEQSDSIEDWYVVNDGVMGGVSEGVVSLSNKGTLLFSGKLSLKNNGGFTSIRSKLSEEDLSSMDGLIVRVRGDGRSYYVNLYTRGLGSATSFRAALPTSGKEVDEIAIPFSQFQLTRFGRKVLGRPLNPRSIQSMGFTLADSKEGPFKLEILSIEAFRQMNVEPPANLSASALILLAIERGVPLFNQGAPAACRSIYEITCHAVLSMPQVPKAIQQDLTHALQKLPQSPDETTKAWLLRDALDQALIKLSQQPESAELLK